MATWKQVLYSGGALGTPASGVGSNLTALNGTQVTTGTVPVARTAAKCTDADADETSANTAKQVANALTAGTSLKGIKMSGSYNGGTARTVEIADPINLTALTVLTDDTDDKILLFDESASEWKHMTLAVLGATLPTGSNYYLDGVTQASNVMTFSMGGSGTDVTFTFGSNAFNSTTIPSAAENATITLAGGNGIKDTPGAFTTNQSSNETITLTLDVDDTNVLASGGIAADDYIVFADTSDSSATKKTLVSKLPFDDYAHTTYDGDDISLDTTALSGAVVISDLDFNVTTDTEGHVTDANASIATRSLTAANVGAIATGAAAASVTAQMITDLGNLSNTNSGDQTLPTDFVSAASGGTFGGAVIINGSLTVSGDNTTVLGETVKFTDSMLHLNSNKDDAAADSDPDAGFYVERGSSSPDAYLFWDESEDEFFVKRVNTDGSSVQAWGINGVRTGVSTAASTELGGMPGDMSIDGSGEIWIQTA